MTRYLFAILTGLFLLAAILGGPFELGITWVALWGLASALCGIGWSLCWWLEDRPDTPDSDYDLDSWPGMLLHPTHTLDDDELPYRPIVHSEIVYTTNNWQHNESGKKPLWPNDIGSVE